jgi:hypothetical protein
MSPFAKMTTTQIHTVLAVFFYGMVIFLSLGLVGALLLGFDVVNIPTWLVNTSIGIGTFSMIALFASLFLSSRQ